jgi:hypothetical protein
MRGGRLPRTGVPHVHAGGLGYQSFVVPHNSSTRTNVAWALRDFHETS